AAVEQDLQLRADRVGDLRQRLDRGWRAVELAPAMVGYDDGLRAALGGDLGVLDIKDALEHQLARPDRADPIDVLPVQRGVVLRSDPGRERSDVIADLEMADEIAEGAALAAQHAGDPG